MTGAGADFIVSTSRKRIDLDFVCAALASSYWAQSRPRGVVEASLRSSLCFGVYEKTGGRQVAFARVVTDGATFSWLCDVIVDKDRRGSGLGKLLMSAVTAHPRLVGTMFLLGTRDAHGLYEKFGFVRAEMMRRVPPTGMPHQPQNTATAPASP
jgi:GNAT superfamily N-acetyltransferase